MFVNVLSNFSDVRISSGSGLPIQLTILGNLRIVKQAQGCLMIS